MRSLFNNIIKTKLLLLFIFVGSVNAVSQNKVYRTNSISLETFGSSFFGQTINYEKKFPFQNQVNSNKGILVRVGVGINFIEIGYWDEKYQYIIPLNVSFYLNNFEAGGGITHTDIEQRKFVPQMNLNYRFESKNAYLKLSIAFLYAQYGLQSESCGFRGDCDPKQFFPFPGLSLGYKF